VRHQDVRDLQGAGQQQTSQVVYLIEEFVDAVERLDGITAS
jgi:hypothetical protein